MEEAMSKQVNSANTTIPLDSANTTIPNNTTSRKEMDIQLEALNHFVQGKRHLLVRDYASAVTSLQEACQLLATQYGELANECGDAYYYYGCALLETARVESRVIDNPASNEVSEEHSEEDDSEELEDKNEEDSKESDNNDQQCDDNEDSKGVEESKEPDSPDRESKGEGETLVEDDQEDEEVSNLQLAWEMFELSKLIYKKQCEGNKANQLKLSDVHMKLGEVGIESENYQQAIEDFLECLSLQEINLQSDNRTIAETHYQLGLAYSFADKFDDSLMHLCGAINVLRERIANLQNRINEKERREALPEDQRPILEESEESKLDPFYSEKDEIEELKKVIPELEERVQDTEESKQEMKRKLQATFIRESAIESADPSVTSSIVVSSGSSCKPVSNIGHLVKKKESAIESADPSVTSSIVVSSGSSCKPVSNIGHLVKKKRKLDDDDLVSSESKQNI